MTNDASVLLVGGFDREGKSILLQMLIDELMGRSGTGSISLVLNELEAEELRGSKNDSYTIHIEDLRGGCPCCSIESDLKEVLKKEGVEKPDVVIIEVMGACDLEQLKQILTKMDGQARAVSYFVLDAPSFRPLLEIVPVFRHNIIVSDRLFLARAEKSNVDDLKDMMEIFTGRSRFRSE